MANDFSSDSSVKALWRLESGALTVDSIGTNTLTPLNTPTSDTSDYKEGSGCGVFASASNQRLYRADTDLAVGFPLKSGDTTKQISFTCWFKPTTINSYCVIVGKKDWQNSKVSLALCVRSNGVLFLSWGYQAGQSELSFDTATLTAGHWYYAAVVADGVNKTAKVYVWDISAGTLTVYANTFSSVLYVIDNAWAISGSYGGTYPFNGKIDEVVVFNRLITTLEIIAIKNGTYSGKIDLTANNFSADSSCLALWNFNAANIDADSKGSNTLSNVTVSPYNDNALQVEGDNCIDVTSYGGTNYYWALQIADGSLCSGFPFKNGDTGKKLTMAGWIYPCQRHPMQYEGFGGSFIGKSPGLPSSVTTGFAVWMTNSNPSRLQIMVGVGGAQVTYDTGIDFIDSQWYHVALEIDGNAPIIYVRVYDAFANSVYTYSVTPSGTIAANNKTLGIGCDANSGVAGFKGSIDQWVVFNRLLSDSEIDKIRSGTYGLAHTYNLASTCAAVSVVSTPIAVITRPLTSSPAVVSTVASPILTVVRALQTSVMAGSVVSSPLLAILRNLVLSVSGITVTGTPVLAVVRPFISSVGAVSAVSAPNLAIQRALASIAAVIGATSDVHLLLNAILDLTATVVAQSQVSTPALKVVRPLNSVMSSQTQASAAILVVLRPLMASVAAVTQNPAITLKVWRDLEATMVAQSTASIPALNLARLLAAAVLISTNSQTVALTVLRDLVATISVQTSVPDVVLTIRAAVKLLSAAIAVQTQTSDINLILTFYESLLAKANRHYGSINADALEAAALQWLFEEEEKEQHLPQQEYDG